MKALAFLLPILFFTLLLSSSLSAQNNAPQYSPQQWDSLLLQLYKQGAEEEMIPLIPVAIASIQPTTADTARAKLYLWAALTAQYNQDYTQAHDYLQKNLETLPKTSFFYHKTQLQLANLFSEETQYKQAEPIYKEICTLLPDSSLLHALALKNLATLYAELEQREDADALYRRAIELHQRHQRQQTRDYADCIIDYASLLQETTQYEQAEQLYREAIVIYKKLRLDNHPQYASILNNMGLMYRRLNRYSDAETLYKKTLEIDRRNYGELHPQYANTLGSLAALYRNQQRFSEAEALFRQALEIHLKTVGKAHPYYLRSLANLAMFFLATGRLDEAATTLQQAADGFQNTFGQHNGNYLRCLNGMAEIHLQRRSPQDSSAAVRLCAEALRLNVGLETPLDSNILLWSDSLRSQQPISIEMFVYSFSILASIYQESPDVLLQISEISLSALDKTRQSFSSEADKLIALQLSHNWTLKGIEASQNLRNAQKGFLFAEQSKSVLLAESLRRSRAHQFGDLPDSLAQKEQALLQQHKQLYAATLENRPTRERDSLRAALNQLNLQIADFKKQIETGYPRYAALQYENASPSIAEFQRYLSSSAAILQYFVSEEGCYLYYLDANSVECYPIAVPADSLQRQITRLHSAMSDFSMLSEKSAQAYALYTSTAYWCYQQLLAKALQAHPDKTQLIIIPDGDIAHIPFEALIRQPAPNKGESYADLSYLIQTHRISYNYSASLWRENITNIRNKPNNGKLLAIAANYEAPKDSALAFLRLPSHLSLRRALRPLKAARQEVERLAQAYMGTFLFDAAASESAFKKTASEYAILHLAMHGILDEEQPLLSSLAFTEQGDSSENNFLQAYEISQMQLSADLIVISACETGYGRFERGNGTASLARAFMYAGVPSMLVSLWAVNDEATALLMELFYAELAKGIDKDQALQNAKRQYLQNAKGIAAAPAFWAAFVQIGDTRPVKLQTKTPIASGLWAYFVVVAAAVAMLGGYWYYRRRKKNTDRAN